MIEARSRKHCSHNRILLSLLMVLLYPSLLFAENIPLIKKGGVYELPVEVNGVITLNFILDTGASEVNIPADVAWTLYRTGTIRDADFLPGQIYRLADGSTVKSSRFILKSLKIGRSRVTNVPASIGNISSSLLLGQSFLEKLSAWGLDSQKQILTIGVKPDKSVFTEKPFTAKTALSGLGDVKFSMSVDEVKQVKPNAKFDLHRQGECDYKGSLYGCVIWREYFYGYDAQVAVQFVSRKKIHQIIILFYSIRRKDVCSQFKADVLVSLIPKYGIPEEKDRELIWDLDGGKMEFSEACINVDYLLYSIVSLKPL